MHTSVTDGDNIRLFSSVLFLVLPCQDNDAKNHLNVGVGTAMKFIQITIIDRRGHINKLLDPSPYVTGSIIQ